MADKLSQVQDAVDEVGIDYEDTNEQVLLTFSKLATQMVACLHYLNRHHDLQKLSATDTIREEKKPEGAEQSQEKERA